MRKLLRYCAIFYFTVTFSMSCVRMDTIVQKIFIAQIAHLDGVSDLTILKTDHFAGKCQFFFEQPIHHQDLSKGVFKQRVFVAHRGFNLPTVFVTEGYDASFAQDPAYTEELARLFNTNIVVVEHRYFEESTPSLQNWEYLTAENSAYDLHNIYTSLSTIYPAKWISTGISKGGQTSMFYKMFFPDDMDISVAYVAPLTRDIEDERCQIFLRDLVGTPEQRKIVENFQLEILKRRNQLMPMFAAHCNEENYRFRTSLDEIYDFCVLEYLFAHWQWGLPIEEVPSSTESDEDLFNYFKSFDLISFFDIYDPGKPSSVQFAKELGFYGYDIEPFTDYLTISNAKGFLNRLILPEDANISFDITLHNKILDYLTKEDPRIIFIYGQYDPWSAVAVDVSINMENKKNMIVAYVPKGSHDADIKRLPPETQNRVISTIKKWLDE